MFGRLLLVGTVLLPAVLLAQCSYSSSATDSQLQISFANTSTATIAFNTNASTNATACAEISSVKWTCSDVDSLLFNGVHLAITSISSDNSPCQKIQTQMMFDESLGPMIDVGGSSYPVWLIVIVSILLSIVAIGMAYLLWRRHVGSRDQELQNSTKIDVENFAPGTLLGDAVPSGSGNSKSRLSTNTSDSFIHGRPSSNSNHSKTKPLLDFDKENKFFKEHSLVHDTIVGRKSSLETSKIRGDSKAPVDSTSLSRRRSRMDSNEILRTKASRISLLAEHAIKKDSKEKRNADSPTNQPPSSSQITLTANYPTSQPPSYGKDSTLNLINNNSLEDEIIEFQPTDLTGKKSILRPSTKEFAELEKLKVSVNAIRKSSSTSKKSNSSGNIASEFIELADNEITGDPYMDGKRASFQLEPLLESKSTKRRSKDNAVQILMNSSVVTSDLARRLSASSKPTRSKSHSYRRSITTKEKVVEERNPIRSKSQSTRKYSGRDTADEKNGADSKNKNRCSIVSDDNVPLGNDEDLPLGLITKRK